MKATGKGSISSDFLFCSYCESWLKPSAFSKGSPVCKVCTDVYSQVDSWREPSHSTILNGYINLFIAIRDCAVHENALDDFEAYWVEQFMDVWESLRNLSVSEDSYKISDF